MFGSKYNYERFQRNRMFRDLASSQLGGAPRAGDRAPDFVGRTLQGDTVHLKDFRGRKNVVLTFGSATCPQTAGSLPGLNDLYEDRDPNVEFLFVYTRETHPGEKLGAHQSYEDKVNAAESLRDAEGVDIPIIVDGVDGRIHRKYGRLPNPAFIIDKSGRIAFRSVGTRASVIAAALDELLEVQHEEGKEHAIVCDGEDLSLPSPQLLWRAHRALQRGGRRSIANFRREMGLPGRVILLSSRFAGPVVDNPAKAAAGVFAAALVLGLGVWGGLALRRKSRSTYHSPYESRKFQHSLDDAEGYEAVGI
jgi:alkyl hydroperoxide reductase subunit AhpC